MTGTASIALGGNAKRGADATGIGLPKVGTTSRRIARAIREMQPRKAWGYLAETLCLTERTARHRLAESREFSVDELAALLRSEDGFQILGAVMADAEPKWWRMVCAYLDVADAQKMHAVAQRRITRAVRGALEANAELEQTIARGTTALALSDPEFYGERLAPQRELLGAQSAMGRVPNSPLAPSKGKR